jgi:hypothetical protein
MPLSKRLILVLDESGSMSSQKSDIIGGINEMITEQRKTMPTENSRVFFNIIKFNNIVSPTTNDTLESIKYLTDADYRPSGGTALYDAMGQTMDKYRNEHDVIMIIATDGEENSSKTYTYNLITKMVEEFKNTKGWNFIYLSENIDTFKQGNSIGICHDAYACNNLAVGKGNIGSTMGNTMNQECISKMRMGDRSVKLSSVHSKSYNPTISSLSGQPLPNSSNRWW